MAEEDSVVEDVVKRAGVEEGRGGFKMTHSSEGLCNVGKKREKKIFLDGGRMEQMLSASLPHARVHIQCTQPGFRPALCGFLPLGLMALE